MGTKILKIVAGAIVMGSGVVLTKIGLDKKVEKKTKTEEVKAATGEKTEETVKAEKAEEPEKVEKREPRKGGKKWRKAQAEQNK